MGEYSANDVELFVDGKLVKGHSSVGVISIEHGVYDNPNSCNSCGKLQNECRGNPWDGGEVTTKCQSCGHEDMWECGHFHSGCDGLNASEKYGSSLK